MARVAPALSRALDRWQPKLTAQRALFTPAELAKLDAARRAVSASGRTVAYCVFENPFARAGGIFAVATHLPPALKAAGENVVLLTPFHRNLVTTPQYYTLNHLGDLYIPFARDSVRTEIFEHWDGLGNRWILMQAWGIFDAAGGPDGKNPYAYDSFWLLLRDALFASAAAPHVLAHLGIRQNVIFHAQDWQFAATALTVKDAVLKGLLDSAAAVLTSHNPYDSILPDYHLGWITGRTGWDQWPLGRDTFYRRMIPLTDAPLSTVSLNFARELTADPLQADLMAAHLQDVYASQGVVGVDNPLFGAARDPFSEAASKEGRAGRPALLLKEKLAKRRTLLDTLERYRDARIFGGLDGGDGAPLTELPDDTPIFMMFGRMDPAQKGFDLLARAIEGFAPGEAKFILTPIVGAGTDAYVDDLRRLATRRAGDVAVYPFRMESGYMEAMAGATFAVMPSIYEPFGAATEAYLAGTPVVARATGGLLSQVIDFRNDPAKGTGLLFHEKLALGPLWRGVVDAPDPETRVHNLLYVQMAEALYDALQTAARLWRTDRAGYARLLANVYPQALSFSTEAAADGYRAIYDRATADDGRLASI